MKVKEKTHIGCDNCKYFIVLYYRNKYNYAVATGNGECVLKSYTEEERAKLPYGFVCDKWTKKEHADLNTSELKNELVDISAKIRLVIKNL
ncbi:MAG: hypothetical protein K2I29_02435 [Clostridia bacterium]|nr:hypothetical protein [Clostridia bacterium]